MIPQLHRLSSRAGSAIQHVAEHLGWIVERYTGSESLPGHLRRVFAQNEVDCVLDVGANRGQFASMLRRSGYTGRIISFEPVPEAFAELLANTAGDGQWEARRLAFGNRRETLPFNVTASSSVSSFFAPTEEYSDSYAGGRVERIEDVEVVRLDAIFADLKAGTHVFLKVDTQGYDERVVEGASGCMDHIVGIQIEMSVMPIYVGAPNYINTFGLMEALGFRPSGIFPVVRDEKLRVYEFDGVFVRAEHDDQACPAPVRLSADDLKSRKLGDA